MSAIGGEDVPRAVLGPGWLVRSQGPIALDDDSEPEPDVAVTRGSRRDYSRRHPSRPALVVEVAESSLSVDREYKGSLYARAGLDDYWILNLVDRVLEVYRAPVADPSAPFGWRYASNEVLALEMAVAPQPTTGRASLKVVPWPRTLSTEISAPGCFSTSDRTIERPRPVPSGFVV